MTTRGSGMAVSERVLLLVKKEAEIVVRTATGGTYTIPFAEEQNGEFHSANVGQEIQIRVSADFAANCGLSGGATVLRSSR